MEFLQKNEIKNAFVVGFTTDICISRIVENLLEIYDGRIIVISDCVATDAYKANIHKEKLQEFSEHPDIKVITSTQIEFTNS